MGMLISKFKSKTQQPASLWHQLPTPTLKTPLLP
jgi:hypothetical protein